MPIERGDLRKRVRRVNDERDVVDSWADIEAFYDPEFRCTERLEDSLPPERLVRAAARGDGRWGLVDLRDDAGMVVGFAMYRTDGRVSYMVQDPAHLVEISEALCSRIKVETGETPWGPMESDRVRSILLEGDFELAPNDAHPQYPGIVVYYVGD